MINEAIFREYDIRGLAESELADAAVERIAMAAAAVYVREGKKEIAMGMDGRPSSPRIKNLFGQTLARYGLQVTDLGLVRRHHHRFAQPERIQRLQDPARHGGTLRRADQGNLPFGL
jgi:phosphomannomutase